MRIAHAIISTLIIIFAVPVLGLIIKALQTSCQRFIARHFGCFVANLISIFLTFPGVVHHELSHALYCILTGGKVTKMVLFSPESKGNGSFTLGYVNWQPRGPWLFQSIQYYMASMAPTIQGIITLALLRQFIMECSSVGLRVALLYLAFSIFLHMDMSQPDVKGMAKGLPVCTVIIFVICMTFGIDLLSLFRSLNAG